MENSEQKPRVSHTQRGLIVGLATLHCKKETNTNNINIATGGRSDVGQQRMMEGDRPQQEVTLPMVGHMMAGGQSRKDATSLNTDLLTPKIIERIGCWNVRTMHQVGKTEQVLQEMHNYNLSILRVT